MRSLSFLLLLATVQTAPLSAQNSQSQKDTTRAKTKIKYTLEEIQITAARSERPLLKVPYTVSIRSKLDIQQAALGLSLDEILREIPGVMVNDRNNLSQGDRISIRGLGSRAAFGVRGVKILLDDIPLSMPDGQSQLNNLNLGSTDRIEILRGPSSTLYGNASGGVINIRSELPGEDKLVLEPRVTVGSHGLQKVQARVSSASARHGFVATSTRLSLNGFRDHSESKFTTLNTVSRHKVSDKITLNTVVAYYDTPYLLNPSSLHKTDADATPEKARAFIKSRGAGKKLHQGQGGVTLNYRSSQALHFKTTVYGVTRSLFNPIPDRIIDLKRKAAGLRSLVNKQFTQGETTLKLSFGNDLEMQADERLEFVNEGLNEALTADEIDRLNDGAIFDNLMVGAKLQDQDESVKSVGTFAELEIDFNQSWAFTAGLRYDWYHFKVEDHLRANAIDASGKRTMTELSPMLGLMYYPQPNLAIYSNFTTGFQTPTTTELGNRPSGEGGFNPALEPERIRSYEVGLKGLWVQHRLQLQSAVFQMNIQDMLIPFQLDDPTSDQIFYRNAGKTRNRGIEVSLSWHPFPALRSSIAYSYMDFQFEDYLVESDAPGGIQLSGNKVPGVPPHQFFLGLRYNHGLSFYSELDVRSFAETFANDFNGPEEGSEVALSEFVNDAYALVDLSLGYRQTWRALDFDFFFRINNLFDKRYNGSIVPNAFGNRFFEPAPGISFYNGLNVSYHLK